MKHLITIVSGYWEIEKSKHGKQKYNKFLKISLKINAPYIIFTNNIKNIEKYRKELETYIYKKKKYLIFLQMYLILMKNIYIQYMFHLLN